MQLKTEQAAGRLFEGREEGSIAFTPTYKYAANSDEYSAFIKNKVGHIHLNTAWYMCTQSNPLQLQCFLLSTANLSELESRTSA